ncbi:hypothetical protein AB3541_13735 [Acinetobacter baumannii]
MLHNIRQFFCMHIWEYDFDISHDEVCRECRNRQVVDLQIRVDILNKFTQLGKD